MTTNVNVTVTVDNAPVEATPVTGVPIKILCGEFKFDTELVPVGTPLVVGEKYFIDNFTEGDSFANCGNTSPYDEFIATNTTPTTWTSSVLYRVITEVIVYRNDIDVNVSVEKTGMIAKLKVTNGGFVFQKTIPDIIGGSFVNVVDSNTIEFNTQIGVKYFKVEVLP